MSVRLALPLALGLSGATVAQEDATRVPHDDPAAVALGGMLYAEHCAACHGADLEGQPDWKRRTPEGRLPGPPHDETGHTWHHPDRVNVAIVRLGAAEVVGNGYESDMPGFAEILSEDEILATLAYIKSRWPREIIERHDALNAADRP